MSRDRAELPLTKGQQVVRLYQAEHQLDRLRQRIERLIRSEKVLEDPSFEDEVLRCLRELHELDAVAEQCRETVDAL